MYIRYLGLIAIVILCAVPSWALEDSRSEVMQAAATGTGDGTIVDVSKFTSLAVQVTISVTASVTFEGTVNGSTWVEKQCILTSDASAATTATATGVYQCNVAGFSFFRARVSAYTSGTVTVIGRATTAIFSGAGGGGTTGWPTSSTTKTLTWANSLANAMRVGDGVTPICLYTDATLGPQVRPCTDANVSTIIPTNFTWSLYDIEGALAMETVDPDAASTLAMWSYPNAAYRPKKSVWFGAGALSTDGTQCAAPAEVTIASGARLYTIICTDNDAGRMHASIEMPDNWDGGTVTLLSSAIQTAASAGVIEYQASAQCKGDTEALVAAASYGTEVVWTDTLTGTNAINKATSGAITPSGTCAAGDFLALIIDIGATNTTTAMTTLHTVGFKMEYSVVSRSQ